MLLGLLLLSLLVGGGQYALYGQFARLERIGGTQIESFQRNAVRPWGRQPVVPLLANCDGNTAPTNLNPDSSRGTTSRRRQSRRAVAYFVNVGQRSLTSVLENGQFIATSNGVAPAPLPAPTS